MLPDIRNLAKRRRRHSPVTPLRGLHQHADDQHVSDAPSSPPSLTHSPNLQAAGKTTAAAKSRGRGRQREPSPALMTAALTSLLPRRRNPLPVRADPYDLDASDGELDASGLGRHDDELAHIGGRTRSRRTAAAGRSTGGRPAPLADAQDKRLVLGSASKGKQTAATSTRAKRTYTVRTSDKENEEDDEAEDDSVDAHDAHDSTFDSQNTEQIKALLGEELTRARKKFKEVDKWELSFEEVIESSPPPVEAR